MKPTKEKTVKVNEQQLDNMINDIVAEAKGTLAEGTPFEMKLSPDSRIRIVGEPRTMTVPKETADRMNQPIKCPICNHEKAHTA